MSVIPASWSMHTLDAAGRMTAPHTQRKETCGLNIKQRLHASCAGHLLVRRGGGDNELIAVHVLGARGHGRHLLPRCGLLLDVGNLLALHAGRRDLRAQNDVPDLALQAECASARALRG